MRVRFYPHLSPETNVRSNTLEITSLSLQDLRSRPATWSDPDGLAIMNQPTLRAFESNPLARRDQPAQLIATVHNRVAGRLDLLAGEIWVDGTSREMSWASHLIVNPTQRRLGVARALLRKQHSLFSAIGGCGFTPESTALVSSEGWSLFSLPRYVFPRRSGALLSKFIRAPKLAREFARIVDGPRQLLPVLARRLAWRDRAAKVVPSARAPASIDPHMRQDAARLQPHRSAAWINWLLGNHFNELSVGSIRSRSSFFLIEDRTGQALGYFVIKVRGYRSTPRHRLEQVGVAYLADWMIFDKRAISERDLFLQAIERMCGEDVDMLFVYPSGRVLAALLVGLGFFPYSRLVYGFAPGSSDWKGLDHRRRSNWRLRPSEADNHFN